MRSIDRIHAVLAVAALVGSPVQAGSHLWVINEAYSNADGTTQFIEMWNPSDPNENFIANKEIYSMTTGNEYVVEENLPPRSTADKYLLFATQGFADIPGAPTPDHIIIDNFFSIVEDSIQWHMYLPSALEFSAGELPLDGVLSIAQDGTIAPASPKNWPGETFQPPGVSDGTDGVPLLVAKTFSALQLSWDTTSCVGVAGYHIVYGEGLPSSPGGSLDPSGGVCPATGFWSAPSTADLLWFVVVANDGESMEGSWGRDSGGLQRQGSGPGGSSNVCGISTRSVANTCGF